MEQEESPASGLNVAAAEFKPRPASPHHGNSPRQRGPHHPGECEAIAAVAEEEEPAVAAEEEEPAVAGAGQAQPRLNFADARKVVKQLALLDVNKVEHLQSFNAEEVQSIDAVNVPEDQKYQTPMKNFSALRRDMMECVHTEHFVGRKVLLQTPSGFALFDVEQFVLKEDKNIWMYFADSREAHQVLFTLGFVKADSKSASDDVAVNDLSKLIQKFCKSGDKLVVEDIRLKGFIENTLDVSCICDGHTVSELLWGIKNVLHEFIPEEKGNITANYYLPLSKELIKALQYYLINISKKMLDKSFISTFGYLCYMDMNLKAVSKDLRNLYDKFVGIGESIEDDLTYAKVLAISLLPEFVNDDLCMTLSEEMSFKLEQTKQFLAESEVPNFSLRDIRRIMGSLDYLLNAPLLRDEILTRVKLMEASRFQSEMSKMIYDMRTENGYEAVQQADRTHYGDHVDFEGLKLRRTLLETPSGFAIFDVHENLFQEPERIWTYFSDPYDARNVAFALGFIKVDDKSLCWNDVTDPGDKLRQLILRFCKDKVLFVENSELKAIIQSKLHVNCLTDEVVAGELIWGLRFGLSNFILEESGNLTDEYHIPLSKGLQADLKTYKINFSPRKVDRDFIYTFGHVINIGIKLDTLCKDLSDKYGDIIPSLCLSKRDSVLATILRDHSSEITKKWKDLEINRLLKSIENFLGAQSFRSKEQRNIIHSIYSIQYLSEQKFSALQDLRHWEKRSKGACSVHGEHQLDEGVKVTVGLKNSKRRDIRSGTNTKPRK